MATCGHAPKLEVSGSWILLQQRLQQTNEKTTRSDPLHFDFCDGDIRDDFDCIPWVENERELTEHTMAINQHVKIQHNSQSLAIHFKIVHNVHSVLAIKSLRRWRRSTPNCVRRAVPIN
ncbi:hypothetical protein M3Y94_00018500 [Aphelenchoides besseyi]|nr:hypothetical protein M3Y94_00018500 [Aphelenchoides besseyi]